jgi:hypothetical protein
MRVGRGIRISVVGEDDDHDRFAWHALLALGFHPREIRLVPRPADPGAAEQWVRAQYAREVPVCRRKSASQQVALLVLIDADAHATAHRHRQLGDALRSAGLPPRRPDERIVIWVPKRSVETWVAFLRCDAVDETIECPHAVFPADYRAAARLFIDWYRNTGSRTKTPLDSINTAWAETQRLEWRDS